MQQKSTVKRLVLAALFLSLGYVLPFLTGQIQQIGNMLLPMHIPVLLCGLICGWKYGLAIGALLPLSRSLIFGMPLLYPSAVAMSFELATYGFLIGFLFFRMPKRNLAAVYLSLMVAMLGGRLVWGIAQAALLGFAGKSYTLTAFFAGAILNAVPGIVLQLILIPSVMLLLDRTHLIPFQADR